jgi:hypothetical protein
VTSLESLIGLLLASVVLAALARRAGAPYPAFLALGGAGLAFVPGVPIFRIEPDLALALFVAPVLLDAAYDASPRDLKRNWAALTGLVIVAVIVTTVGRRLRRAPAGAFDAVGDRARARSGGPPLLMPPRRLPCSGTCSRRTGS